MRIRSFFFILPALALLIPAARATTVVPPSFMELVDEADAIYRGRVAKIEARRVDRGDGNGTVIKTFVTFGVERVLKGTTKEEVVLEFLGGTVGEDTLQVSGMPKFALGDREFVFVQKNGLQFCPLVGLGHGRYRVLRDAARGRDIVARDNGQPLTDTAEVALPLQESLPPNVRAARAEAAISRAMTSAAFEEGVSTVLNRRGAKTTQK